MKAGGGMADNMARPVRRLAWIPMEPLDPNIGPQGRRRIKPYRSRGPRLALGLTLTPREWSVAR